MRRLSHRLERSPHACLCIIGSDGGVALRAIGFRQRDGRQYENDCDHHASITTLPSPRFDHHGAKSIICILIERSQQKETADSGGNGIRRQVTGTHREGWRFGTGGSSHQRQLRRLELDAQRKVNLRRAPFGGIPEVIEAGSEERGRVGLGSSWYLHHSS